MAKLFANRPTGRQIGLFAFLWGAVGFAAGTVTLLGPVRWLTGAVREAGWSDGAESALVVSVIGLLVVTSFWGSLVLTRSLLDGARTGRRLAILGLVPVAAAASLWLWMTPSVINRLQPVELVTVSRFTFGPYPERARFAELRDQGYSGVVSLLHGTMVPFETPLLARERALAKEFGIELIEAPMLPWIGGNEASLDKIRALVDSASGRYYVHCYLGRDRVGMVRRLVQTASPTPVAATASFTLESGSAFESSSFERGAIVEVEANVYLTPFPTDEELLKYFVASDAAHVVSLLDPANPDDLQWIAKEQAALSQYGVSYRNMPLPWLTYEPSRAVEAAEHVRRMPRPVLVHGFKTGGLVAEAFQLAYVSGLPPLPRSLFNEPMLAGPARTVAVNVAIGPRPSGSEFGSYLYRRGIRGVVYVGDPDGDDAVQDRQTVRSETAMTWDVFAADDAELFSTLSAGGPWYVYGSDLSSVQSKIEQSLGSHLVAVAAGQ